MPVTAVTRNPDARSLAIDAEFAAPVERVWQVYSDPRQLERVWGPPTHPATVVDHSLTPGGRVTYYMTGPEGERYHGAWRVLEVDEPHRFTFEDYFADSDFNPLADQPIGRCEYSFVATDTGTRASFVTTYETAQALQKVLEMGVEEGATSAMGQIDALLADG